MSRNEHENFFENARRGQCLTKAARAFLREADDFITTQTGLIHKPITWLIFGGRPWLVRVFMVWSPSIALFCVEQHHIGLRTSAPGANTTQKLFRSPGQIEGSTYSSHLLSDRLNIFITIATVSLALLPLLTPVGILYLVPLSKGLSAVVVVLFGIAFATFLSRLDNITIDTILVGLSAYMAVLVTFLANVQGNQCQCPAPS
jgi:hypothetical protein